MTMLAIGFAVVTVSGQGAWRRSVALLAGAQPLGMAAMFVGVAAEVGRRDEYGDHPVAFGIGIVVTAAATVVSLAHLHRSIDTGHARVRVRDSGANAVNEFSRG